jgi:hypothetical protein
MSPAMGILAILSHPSGLYVPSLQSHLDRKERKKRKEGKERKVRTEVSERASLEAVA